MKIALISYEYPPDTGFGGIGTFAYQLAHMLVKRGHHVEVFAGGHDQEGSQEEEGILIHRVRGKQGEIFQKEIAKLFAQRHDQLGFDILEGAEHKADAFLIRQEFPELPLVIKLHTPTYLLGRLFRGKVSWLQKSRFMLGGLVKGRLPRPYWKYDKSTDPEYLLTKGADAILSPSLDLGDIISHDWEIPREKIGQLPNLFQPRQALLSLEVPRQKEVVRMTFIGKLEKRKGIVPLTKAVKLLLQQFPQLHFRCIGAYDHPSPFPHLLMGEYVKNELKSFTDRLELTGPVPNQHLSKLLDDTDICIFPSLWENFPYVCLEAMSAARAVVGSRAGGMAEMIEDKVNGLLIPPQSPEAIVEAVSYLIEHPEKRSGFGLKAREKVLSAYNTEVIGIQTEEVYKQVISNKKSRQYA